MDSNCRCHGDVTINAVWVTLLVAATTLESVWHLHSGNSVLIDVLLPCHLWFVATLSQCQRSVFCRVLVFSFELEPTYPYSQNLPVKHCPWLPAPTNWCTFASKELHVASTSPDLRQVALFSEGLSHDRCNCLWQLTGVIYHIGQEGRLFEYELYIDWIKVIHKQNGSWNLAALSSCIHVHRFVPAWCRPLHRRIDGDWSGNVAEKRRHWAYFTILFWQFAEEKSDR